MTPTSAAGSIDEYIAGFPPGTQAVLEEMRALIREAAPAANETMSYSIPTFDLNGRHLVHFAGYAHHVGFYPGASGIAAFRAELAAFKGAKGSVRFPLSRPLPAELIGRIVAFRVEEEAGGASGAPE